MTINTVVFSPGLPDQVPVRGHLQNERPQVLESEKNRYSLPVVLLVDAACLDGIRGFADVVVDRGIKNVRKGLADYLTGLGGDKIPVIDGNYASVGRLQQGIRSLLRQATAKGEKKLYIIGAESRIFKTIWQESGSEKEETRNHSDAVMREPSYEQEVAASNSSFLKELGQNRKVPDKLREIYLGNSENFELARLWIITAAENLDPVLIQGGTGSGKEIVARQIHQYSKRAGGPFVPINCGAIPEGILESELFGHKKGAFTNAVSDKEGLWAAAEDGTLFLDEIGDLSLANQVKILRALTERFIRPLGSNEQKAVNARIIAASNRELFAMVQSGEFREDLYYRLRSFFIRTPSLRNNKDDIPLMAQILWKRIAPPKSKPLSPEILAELKKHTWPGNVRELKTVLRSLNNYFPERELGAKHLKIVFYCEDGPAQLNDAPVTEKDLIFEKVKCLRHLRRAHEIVHACEYAVDDFIKVQSSDTQKIEAGQTNLRFRYHELLRFCSHGPAFFPNEATFVAVGTIKDKMTWLITRLKNDPCDVKNFWKVDLESSFKNAQAVLFKGIERLLSDS